MRIVVIEPDGQGGLFHFAFQLCTALGRLGHDVTLITATDAEFSVTDGSFAMDSCMRLWSRTEVADGALPEGLGGRIQRLAKRMGRSVRRVYRGLKLMIAWRGVLQRVESARPDAVIVSMILHLNILWLATRIAAPDRVLAQICHELVERDIAEVITRRTWRDNVKDRLETYFDRIFFLSEATRQDFLRTRKFLPERTTRIPHGRSEMFGGSAVTAAAMRRRLGFAPDDTVILFFGILRPSKGLDELIDAFAMSRARNKAKLLIAGRATKFMDMTALTARINRHALSDAVRIENRYIDPDEVAPIFELARAVVLPYRNAAASGVLHMAYAFERAPIVTAVGGLAEDVVDGETGLVAPQGDTAALSSLIDRLVDDAGLAAELGRLGNAFSKRSFGWASVAERIADAMLSDLASRRSNGASASRDHAERQAAQPRDG